MNISQGINDQKINSHFINRRRIVFEGAVYHITQRAPGREYIFLEDNDYLYFLRILKNTTQKFQLQVIAFALLSNHVHLLIQITEKNISLAMKYLFERYASYFNKKYQRKGHVFCGRFRSSLCCDDAYFLAVSVYIHLNPLRAGLCNNFRDYRWTSVHLFIDSAKETFVAYEKILSFLAEDPEKARQQYAKTLTDVMKIKVSAQHDARSIQKAIKGRMNIFREIISEERKRKLDKLIDGVKKGGRVRGAEDRSARKYALEQLLANGYSLEEIQKLLGMSRATFYRVSRCSF